MTMKACGSFNSKSCILTTNAVLGFCPCLYPLRLPPPPPVRQRWGQPLHKRVWLSAMLPTVQAASGACEQGRAQEMWGRRLTLPSMNSEERNNNSRGDRLCISERTKTQSISVGCLFVSCLAVERRVKQIGESEKNKYSVVPHCLVIYRVFYHMCGKWDCGSWDGLFNIFLIVMKSLLPRAKSQSTAN